MHLRGSLNVDEAVMIRLRCRNHRRRGRAPAPSFHRHRRWRSWVVQPSRRLRRLRHEHAVNACLVDEGLATYPRVNREEETTDILFRDSLGKLNKSGEKRNAWPTRRGGRRQATADKRTLRCVETWRVLPWTWQPLLLTGTTRALAYIGTRKGLAAVWLLQGLPPRWELLPPSSS